MNMKRRKKDCRTFLKKSGFKAREGKQVYISLANHKVITEIVYLLGDGKVGIADYLDNVLNEHFVPTVPKSTVCWTQPPK